MYDDDELSVSVRIPHGDDLDDLDPDVWCMSVPGPLVECNIDTLQAVLAQWKDDAGNSPDDDKWGPDPRRGRLRPRRAPAHADDA
jgi:hypothetical protein